MPIYKQYDQAALDRQYNNRLHVPDFQDHLDRWESLSRQTEQRSFSNKNIAYGNLSLESLDIYPSSQPHSKTLTFIHGGYWYKLDKSGFQFMADAFRDHGVTTVIINYPLAPTVVMDQISISCRLAIQWIYKNIIAYNGDPDQLYVAGHSAGGHLAAMMMATQWKDFSLATDVIKGVCAISGLYNLIPIQLSDINQVLNMDTAMALRNSPVQLQPSVNCPLIIAVGKDETDEFIDQSRELNSCWKEKINAELLEIPGLNHYSILATMLDSSSALHQSMRRLMNI